MKITVMKDKAGKILSWSERKEFCVDKLDLHWEDVEERGLTFHEIDLAQFDAALRVVALAKKLRASDEHGCTCYLDGKCSDCRKRFKMDDLLRKFDTLGKKGDDDGK